MSSIDFVINIINELVERFPTIQCTYEFNEASNTHFVEVLPNSVYNLDEDYAKAETKATIDFIEKYPFEGLCFITNDAIVQLNDPIYIKSGTLFLEPAMVTFITPGTNSYVDTVVWDVPISLGVGQSKSLFEMMTSFMGSIKYDKYWTFSSSTVVQPAEPIVISDEVESELPLAA